MIKRLSTGSWVSRVERITCSEVHFPLHNSNCSWVLNTSPGWLASADIPQISCLSIQKAFTLCKLTRICEMRIITTAKTLLTRMPCVISNADCNSCFLSDNSRFWIAESLRLQAKRSRRAWERKSPNSQWVTRCRNSAMYSVTSFWGLWLFWWNVNHCAITSGSGSKCCKDWVMWSSDLSWGFSVARRSQRMR